MSNEKPPEFEAKLVVDVYVSPEAAFGDSEAANTVMYVSKEAVTAYMERNHPRLLKMVEAGVMDIRLVVGGYAEGRMCWLG